MAARSTNDRPMVRSINEARIQKRSDSSGASQPSSNNSGITRVFQDRVPVRVDSTTQRRGNDQKFSSTAQVVQMNPSDNLDSSEKRVARSVNQTRVSQR